MDDRVFDEKTAREWISVIEGAPGLRNSDIYPRLRAWMARAAPAELLEIGCGQGICSDQIELEGGQYTGLEPSSFLVERARQQYSSAGRAFVEGNIYDLPFASGAFDAAYSVAVWHLLGDLRLAAFELGRVLKERGHFLIITANPAAYAAWKSPYVETRVEGRRLEGLVRAPGRPDSRDTLYLHTLAELTDSLGAAGLEVQETEAFRPAEVAGGRGLFISIRGQKLPGG